MNIIVRHVGGTDRVLVFNGKAIAVSTTLKPLQTPKISQTLVGNKIVDQSG